MKNSHRDTGGKHLDMSNQVPLPLKCTVNHTNFVLPYTQGCAAAEGLQLRHCRAPPEVLRPIRSSVAVVFSRLSEHILGNSQKFDISTFFPRIFLIFPIFFRAVFVVFRACSDV